MATTITTEPDSCDPPCSTISYLCSHKQPHLYNDPRLLSCLHSFCKTCLTDLVNSTNTTIICPTCYEPTLLPNNSGVDNLPCNLRLVHEIEATTIIAKANSSTPIVCEGCITDQPAIAYCVDCEEFICTDCEGTHKRRRNLLHHKLLQINHLNISSLLTKTKPLFCPHHPKEPLDLYCQVCHTVTCRLCVHTAAGHVGHTCTDLDQVADSNKQELQQCLLPLTTAISKLQSSQEMNTAAQLQLKENTEHVKAAIELTFEAVFTALRKRKEKLLQKLHKVSSFKQTRLKMKKKEIVRAAEKLSSSVNVIESTVSTYTSAELVSICDTLKTYLHKKINHYDVNITQSPSVSSSEIEFSVDPKVLVTEIDQFGEVESTVDPSSSVIIGPQISRAIACKKHTIILETKDREGGCCCEGGEKVNVTLVDKNKRDHSINGTVLDKGTGQYTLSFTPPSPGTYEVRVTIDNEHIKNSPFTLYARPYRDYRQLKEPVRMYKMEQQPSGIYTSSDGTMYVSCYTSVYKYKKDGSLIACIGIDKGTVKFKPYNWDIAVKGDVLYVANNGVSTGSIIKLTTTGELIGQFGQFHTVRRITMDEEGKIYVTDNKCIHIFNSDETILKTIKCGVTCKGIALDPSGNIHVTCRNKDCVAVYSQTGKYLRDYGKGQLQDPFGITVDEEGYSLVSEYIFGGHLKIFSPKGKLIHSVGNLQLSTGVCIDNDSNIFVTSDIDNKVYKF